MLSPLEIAARLAPTDEDRALLVDVRGAVNEAIQLADERGEMVFALTLIEALAERFILNAASCDLIEDEISFLVGC